MWFFNVCFYKALWIFLIKQYANPSNIEISTRFSLYIIIKKKKKKKKKKNSISYFSTRQVWICVTFSSMDHRS